MTGEVLRRRVEDDVGAHGAAAAGAPATRTCCRPRPAAAGRPRRRAARRSPRSPRCRSTLRCGFDGVSNQTSRVRSVSASQSASWPARQVDVAGVDPGAAPDPLEVAVRAAVDVVTDDDLVARRRQLGDGRGRRRPRRERDPVLPALERRDRPFEPLAGRVLRAGVLVAAARPRRRRPGRRSRSGRSAARRRRSARRVRRRRGRPACRTRTRGRHRRSDRASGPW